MFWVSYQQFLLYLIFPLRCQWTSPPSRRRRGNSGWGKENRREHRNRNWMILRKISTLMITANFGRRNKWTDAIKCLIESIYVVSHVQYYNVVLYVTLQLKSLEMFVVILLTFYLWRIYVVYFYIFCSSQKFFNIFKHFFTFYGIHLFRILWYITPLNYIFCI